MNKKNKEIKFELSRKMSSEIESIAEETNVSTEEVIRRALELYKAAVESEKVILVRDDRITEVKIK
jgi:hypothetical protein